MERDSNERVSPRRPFRLAAIAVLVAAGAATAASPRYEVIQLGFRDAEHTAPNGAQSTQAEYLTLGGRVAGVSLRFTSSIYPNYDNGSSAWSYDPATGEITRMGFFDADHTGLDGEQWSWIEVDTDQNRLPSAGYVIGESAQFDAAGQWIGWSTWRYDPATGVTRRIGLTGPEYTNDLGGEWNATCVVTETGAVYGTVLEAGTEYARTWLYDPVSDTTVPIPAPDAGAYFDCSPCADWPLAPSAYGVIEAFGDDGTSAWLYDTGAGTTTRIGPDGPEYTASDGTRFVQPYSFAASGLVIGRAARVDATGSWIGLSAWAYDATTGELRLIGLTDPDHTNAAGAQQSELDFVNESGRVAGHSQRFAGGWSAWQYDWATDTTTRIGLLDAEHTSTSGAQFSSVYDQNAVGQVVGRSTRYEDGGSYESSWLYDPATGLTTSIGPVGPQDAVLYMGSLTDSGYVIGQSESTAWVYDPTDGQTFTIALGDATRAYCVTESGAVFGSYDVDGFPTLTRRCFRWTRDTGASDIEPLVHDGLPTTFGLDTFHDAIDGEYAIGDGAYAAFLLIPAPFCEADLDRNGPVDVFDFDIFVDHFGATGLPPFTGGDLDGDRDVDVFDFAEFAPNFGCTD